MFGRRLYIQGGVACFSRPPPCVSLSLPHWPPTGSDHVISAQPMTDREPEPGGGWEGGMEAESDISQMYHNLLTSTYILA